MRTSKFLLGLWLMIFGLAISGCTLFPNNRPAPIRPRAPRIKAPMLTVRPGPTGMTTTPNPKVRTAPTKRIPGLGGISEKTLLQRVNRIEDAAQKNDWGMATRETNTLGMDITRFRSNAPKGKFLRELPSISATYTKLQANVRTKNKTAVMNNLKSMKSDLQKIQSNSRS